MSVTLENLEVRVAKLEREMALIDAKLEMLTDIHNFMFKPARPGNPALIDRVVLLVDGAEKSAFMYKLFVKVVLTGGALASAFVAILAFTKLAG